MGLRAVPAKGLVKSARDTLIDDKALKQSALAKGEQITIARRLASASRSSKPGKKSTSSASAPPPPPEATLGHWSDPLVGPAVVANNEWADSTNLASGWKSFPQWSRARKNANTVLLPDGSMLTVGGNLAGDMYGSPVFRTEHYSKSVDDTSGVWLTVAPHQRVIMLATQVLTNGLMATVPASSSAVPAGYYMLFVLDAAGIPSVAKFVPESRGQIEPI